MTRDIPRIGITVSDHPEYAGVRLREDYFALTERAGGLPLLLPPLPGREAAYCAALDGLIISGGGDYDQSSPSARDRFELALLQEAWRRRLPLLGICRGMQGLALMLGGRLWEDLSERPAPTLKHDQQADRRCTSHALHLLHPLLRQAYGAPLILVNSHHHQGLRSLPAELQIAALAPDGLVEAICAAEPGRWAWGLQWHPEALLDGQPFELLMRAIIENGEPDERHGNDN